MIDNNPKTRYGIKKPNYFYVPPTAMLYLSLGFGDGAQKYGPYNWREKNVSSSVYLSAALRHLNAYIDGEDNAEDSGYPHIAHAMCCLAILADAQENGFLIDDRPIPGKTSELLKKYTK